MLFNIYILNTAPFIETFVSAEEKENSVLKKEVTMCTIVDNILNKLLNNTYTIHEWLQKYVMQHSKKFVNNHG